MPACTVATVLHPAPLGAPGAPCALLPAAWGIPWACSCAQTPEAKQPSAAEVSEDPQHGGFTRD